MNFIYLKSSRIVEVIDKRQVLEIYRFYDEHGLEISDSEMVGARESALFNTIFCEYGMKEIDNQSYVFHIRKGFHYASYRTYGARPCAVKLKEFSGPTKHNNHPNNC